MDLKVDVSDCIYIENENGDQILCIEMNDDMGEITEKLEKMVKYLNVF